MLRRFCFSLAHIPQTRMHPIPCFMTLRASFDSGSTDKSGQRAHCLSSEGVIAVVGNYESATSLKSKPQLCMHRRLRDLRRSRSPPLRSVRHSFSTQVALEIYSSIAGMIAQNRLWRELVQRLFRCKKQRHLLLSKTIFFLAVLASHQNRPFRGEGRFCFFLSKRYEHAFHLLL